MFCDKCGAKTPKNFNFCPKCGHNLQKAHLIVDEEVPTGKQADDLQQSADVVEPVGSNSNSSEKAVDGLLWDSDPKDKEFEASQAQDSPEEDDSLESETTDTSASSDDDPPNMKKTPSSGGKTFFWALLISALVIIAFWFINNRNIPVKVHFIGNFGGYSITTQSGQRFEANLRGEYVYLDTFKLLEQKKIKFTFALNNAKGPGAFYLDYNGRDLSPIDTAHIVTFKRTQSDLNLTFTLNPFVPGAFVVVDGKQYDFGNKPTITIPKIRINSKQSISLLAGTNRQEIAIDFSTNLTVSPGELTIIEKKYTLNPYYAGRFEFVFSVSDELGKWVDGASIQIGYKDLSTKTDKLGEGKIEVMDPTIGSTFSPSVSKGLMAPIEDLKAGSFDPNNRKINYSVKLRVQDRISFLVVDLNGNPIKDALAVTSDGKKGKSDSKGQILVTAKNRGQLTRINISRPGFIETDVSIMIKAGDNVISAPVVLQAMNVRLQVLDQLTGRPIPDIGIKIRGLKGEISTTSDPFQSLFDLELGKTYSFALKDHQGRYLEKTIDRKITSNGQLIDVLLEPKPRYINVHFTDASGKNLAKVKTSLKSDRINFADSDSKGNVKYKVYADTSYLLEYEFKTLVGSQMIYMDGEWEKNPTIRVTFTTDLTIKVNQGTPEIRILDPSSKVVIAKGKGSLAQSLPFGTYIIECDCPGGKYEEIVTLNKSTETLNVDCELPIVKGRGAEGNKQYEEAVRIFEGIPASDKYYCEAQERLFYIKLSEDMLNTPEESGVHAKHIVDNSCQQGNNPYFCIDAFPQLLKAGDYEAAKTAVRTGFKNILKIVPDERPYMKDLLNYYEKLVLQDEAFNSINLSDDEKCERLTTLFGQWENMKQMVTDQELLDNIDIRQSEVDAQLSALGC